MPDARLPPWHRVLRADGRIAFPPGSRSFREQVRRLAGEGILVVAVALIIARHGWERNLDDRALGAAANAKKSIRPARKRSRVAKNAEASFANAAHVMLWPLRSR